MKAARFYDIHTPLKIEEIPTPEPGHCEVVVEVAACGLCGSDIHIAIEGILKPPYIPITLGHEPAGTIAKVGPGVDRWKIGERVCVMPGLSCGECINCLDGRESACLKAGLTGFTTEGALAQFIKIPADHLARLPDNVPFEHGAIITDAVATPYHAITRRGRLKAGEKVAVIGCGGLGIHAVQIARLCGAAIIVAIDTSPVALDRSHEVGATHIVDASQGNAHRLVRDITDGGVDLAVECIGHSHTLDQAIKCLRKGGRAVTVGLSSEKIETVPPTIFTWCEYSLIGSYGYDRLDIPRLLTLASSGKLDLSSSITHRFKLEEVNKGLEILLKKIDNPLRVAIFPNEN